MMTDVTAAELAASAAADPRLALADHHREIERACRTLLEHTYADDSRALVEQYRAFERAILDHLAAEEQAMIARYAESPPGEPRALLDEHTVIRRTLFQVALEVELHCVRAHTLCSLIEQLHAHAARETASMYPWAQLPHTANRRLSVRVGHSMRRHARPAEPEVTHTHA